jgi:hypothetical protein
MSAAHTWFGCVMASSIGIDPMAPAPAGWCPALAPAAVADEDVYLKGYADGIHFRLSKEVSALRTGSRMGSSARSLLA